MFFSCGFCGGKGCTISLKKTSHNTFIPWAPNCQYYKKLSLKSAESAKERNPCSNRPVKCNVCEETYWSYAMAKHFEQSHIDIACPVKVSSKERQWVLAKK